ncbi:hypothetical protein KR038_010169, partial [Drosophila bunnanda]
MNPACRLNLDSPECQTWITAVNSHCGSLLPNAEQASLWDTWWPDELTAPYKTWVSTMSAFDCYRVRKEVATQVDGRLQAQTKSHPTLLRSCRWTTLFLVLLMVLMAMFFALRMVIESWRGKRSEESCTCPPTPKNLKLICVDVESPPCQPCQPCQPRSSNSLGHRSDPLAGYVQYNCQKILKASSVPPFVPKDL